MWRQLGALGILAGVLASCGTAVAGRIVSTTPSAPPSPAPPATPSPTDTITPAASANPLSACTGADQTTQSPSATGPVVAVLTASVNPRVIELVDAAGTVLNQTSYGQVSGAGVAVGPNPVGTGRGGVYLYTSSTGVLSLLGTAGPPQEIAEITPAAGLDDFSLAESPNGRCWIFADTTWDSDDAGTSRLYVGAGGGSSPLLLTTLTRSSSVDGSIGGGYRILGWDSTGVLLGTDPNGVGGAGPFIGEGYNRATVVRLDPVTAALSPPLCSTGRFGNVAPDGTMACIAGEASDARILLTRPDGSTATIDTGTKFAGNLQFVGGSSLLTYCTSDDTPATDGSGAGWTERLWTARLGTSAISPQPVLSGDGPWCEEGAVAGPSSMVELVDSNQGRTTSLALLDLSTGRITTIAPASGILGVF